MTMICSDHPDNVVNDYSDADEAVAAAEGVIPSEEGSSLCQQLYMSQETIRRYCSY
jgi:hypothetical protein